MRWRFKLLLHSLVPGHHITMVTGYDPGGVFISGGTVQGWRCDSRRCGGVMHIEEITLEPEKS